MAENGVTGGECKSATGLEFATEVALGSPVPAMAAEKRSVQRSKHRRKSRLSPLAVFAATLLLAFGTAAPLFAASKVPVPRAAPARTAAPADDGGDDADIPADSDADAPMDDGDADPSLEEPGAPADIGEAIPEIQAPDPITDLLGVGSPARALDLRAGAAANAVTQGNYVFQAKLAANATPLTSGVVWRVYANTPAADGKLPLIREIKGGTVDVRLEPGTYLVHAAYGHAGVAKRVTVTNNRAGGAFVLDAGGLRLSAVISKDQPLPAADLTFDIYAPDDTGTDDRSLLIANAPAGRIISLNTGIYHVVSRYGDANAVVRADIRVDAGKLTDAAIFQKAARMTLKLVTEHGGEALADTAWSVVTQSGETVADSVGAFPSVVLGAGDYRAIAKHDGKIFERTFTVEAGLNRDVEVIAK